MMRRLIKLRRTLRLDERDVLFFGGLVIGTLGGCFLSIPITLVVLGAVLALAGYRGGV